MNQYLKWHHRLRKKISPNTLSKVQTIISGHYNLASTANYKHNWNISGKVTEVSSSVWIFLVLVLFVFISLLLRSTIPLPTGTTSTSSCSGPPTGISGGLEKCSGKVVWCCYPMCCDIESPGCKCPVSEESTDWKNTTQWSREKTPYNKWSVFKEDHIHVRLLLASNTSKAWQLLPLYISGFTERYRSQNRTTQIVVVQLKKK